MLATTSEDRRGLSEMLATTSEDVVEVFLGLARIWKKTSS